MRGTKDPINWRAVLRGWFFCVGSVAVATLLAGFAYGAPWTMLSRYVIFKAVSAAVLVLCAAWVDARRSAVRCRLYACVHATADGRVTPFQNSNVSAR